MCQGRADGHLFYKIYYLKRRARLPKITISFLFKKWHCAQVDSELIFLGNAEKRYMTVEDSLLIYRRQFRKFFADSLTRLKLAPS